MIDFQNGTFAKLNPVDPSCCPEILRPLLLNGEALHLAFRPMMGSMQRRM